MSCQSFHPQPGKQLPPLNTPDEYFNQSKTIDRALTAANHTANSFLTSVDLLQQENILLRREIERVREIIGESSETDR